MINRLKVPPVNSVILYNHVHLWPSFEDSFKTGFVLNCTQFFHANWFAQPVMAITVSILRTFTLWLIPNALLCSMHRRHSLSLYVVTEQISAESSPAIFRLRDELEEPFVCEFMILVSVLVILWIQVAPAWGQH